ncbi:MAG TPA: tetratricopeptide repeat protein [Anaerolineales bacterium]|nr:tetratricopeptide repeat protein [Anaerolineales bacterium]
MAKRIGWFFMGAAMAALIIFLIYQVPFVNDRLGWRLDAASGIVRGWLRPGDSLPTPEAPLVVDVPTAAAIAAAPPATATPGPTPTPLPASVTLPAPKWEKQDWNNCGPATLALALRMFGWEGDQFDVSAVLKPDRGDKNVNVDELVYYVRNDAGWLNADFRVGGTIDLLKRLLAAGHPVIIEEGFTLDENDGGGGWAGHYLLLTGYDDAEGVFLVQDSNKGADQRVAYDALDEGWKAFNRVFLFIYPPEVETEVHTLLGPDADPDVNRQRALATAQAEVAADAQDAYAWFNLGSNLVYFGRYSEAVDAFDTALNLGLPWRFTRYQFGPYIAYFNQGKFQELIQLADYTLFRTNKAEESHLWRGWARYRLGDRLGAIEDFRAALEVNPNYLDAQYALNYVGATP